MAFEISEIPGCRRPLPSPERPDSVVACEAGSKSGDALSARMSNRAITVRVPPTTTRRSGVSPLPAESSLAGRPPPNQVCQSTAPGRPRRRTFQAQPRTDERSFSFSVQVGLAVIASTGTRGVRRDRMAGGNGVPAPRRLRARTQLASAALPAATVDVDRDVAFANSMMVLDDRSRTHVPTRRQRSCKNPWDAEHGAAGPVVPPLVGHVLELTCPPGVGVAGRAGVDAGASGQLKRRRAGHRPGGCLRDRGTGIGRQHA